MVKIFSILKKIFLWWGFVEAPLLIFFVWDWGHRDWVDKAIFNKLGFNSIIFFTVTSILSFGVFLLWGIYDYKRKHGRMNLEKD